MSTTKERILFKEFDIKYKNPHLRLHLEEQGWKYLGVEKDKTIFKIIY